jgi:hypothetical protein
LRNSKEQIRLITGLIARLFAVLKVVRRLLFINPDNRTGSFKMATKSNLEGEVEYNKAENTAALPAIMGWFRRESGGKKKMTELL